MINVIKKLSQVLCLSLFSILPLKAQEPIRFKDITILISSCDKYSDLWKPFFHFFYESWPSLKTYNNHIPILFLTNKETVQDSRLTPVLFPNEASWSDNMLQALERVKTNYVMIVLEDYIFHKPVNEKRLQKVLNGMREVDAAYMQVSADDKRYTSAQWHPHVAGVRYAGKHEPWRTSLQLCVWNTEDLKWLLKSGEGIWIFEITSSQRSEGMRKPFLKIVENEPMSYLNASQEGYLNASVMRWIKDHGSDITATKLPVNEDHKIKLGFRNFLRSIYWNYLPSSEEIKTKIKSFLKA